MILFTPNVSSRTHRQSVTLALLVISVCSAKLERILGVHDLVSDLQTGYINKRQQNVRRTLEDASRKAEEHVDSLQRESNALSGKIAAAKSMLAQKKVEEGELTATLAAQDPRYVAVEFDFDRHVVELEHELRSCRDAAPVVSAHFVGENVKWLVLEGCDTRWLNWG